MKFSSPHGVFSFLLKKHHARIYQRLKVFVPSRGFLFSMKHNYQHVIVNPFSSPHGDFSFLYYTNMDNNEEITKKSFRPLTGISLFYSLTCFVFDFMFWFSSLTGISLFYPISYSLINQGAIFIICGANIFQTK